MACRHATYLDDTLYRRVLSDTRVYFLAEGVAPRLRVFRGQGWARLLDAFLCHRDRPGHWVRTTRAKIGAEDLLGELRATQPEQLVPHTILAAIHRRLGVQSLNGFRCGRCNGCRAHPTTQTP